MSFSDDNFNKILYMLFRNIILIQIYLNINFLTKGDGIFMNRKAIKE